jgi:hypothetical protein
MYTISDTANNFLISYHNEIIYIKFEARIIHTELPSTLTFAYNVLNKIRISSLAYGLVSVNKCVSYVTSEVIKARHDCVINLFAYNLKAPMQLAGCTMYNRYCNTRMNKRFPSGTLLCNKKSHRIYWDSRCQCKLCVKGGAASLKSLCVYKLCEYSQTVNVTLLQNRLCITSISTHDKLSTAVNVQSLYFTNLYVHK